MVGLTLQQHCLDHVLALQWQRIELSLVLVGMSLLRVRACPCIAPRGPMPRA